MPQPIDYLYLQAALQFKPAPPAKLAGYPQIALTLDPAGADGLVYLLVQHTNDRLGAWCALDDTPGAWTTVGSLAATGTLDLPAFEVGPGEAMLLGLGFQSADGSLRAPAVTEINVTWSSDVAAPDAPALTRITSVAPTGGVAGYRGDLGDLPAGARHLLVEGDLNGAGWLPFSVRAKFEAGHGHMLFRGDLAAIEAAGERNETHISCAKGIEVGDVVKLRAAAEDAVGNRSPFVASDPITIESTVVQRIPTRVMTFLRRARRKLILKEPTP